MKLTKNNFNLVLLLLAGLFTRILFSFFGTLQLDFNTFVAWSDSLYKNGFFEFYNNWSDYLPGYLYVLWLLAFIKNKILIIPTEVLYKLPAILSDLVTGYLIYKIAIKAKRSEKASLLVTFIYLFNPAILANSTLWGQVDSLTALFSILSLYLINTNFILSSVFLALGTAIKPQAALTIIAVFYLMIKKRWKLTKILIYLFCGLIIFSVTFLPFSQNKNLIAFVYERIMVTLNQYPYSSVNAFNFWGIFGFWKPDSASLFSPSVIGGLATLLVSMYLILKLKNTKLSEYFLLSIIFIANFLFFSRMHERHLLPAFAPLAISMAVIPDLIIPYVLLSITYLANLYYSYIWITQNFKEVFGNFWVVVAIFVNLLSFVFALKLIIGNKKDTFLTNLFRFSFKKARLNFKHFLSNKDEISLPKINISNRILNIMLIGIIAFSFFSRIIFLNSPPNEYFDEVYHAFTAKVMKQGDPKGWEWWNPHPEGFAYEWTHPPLAKLGMWLGMSVFGENSFGWRITGAVLGTASVFLIYLIGIFLFKDKLLAVLSAFVFSLEGLPLVMSRIGMNDAYLLFFALLSIYFYFRDKDILSSIFFGLALASKWSAVWTIPIFVVSHFTLHKKIRINYLLYIIVPPLIYLATYIPMFLVGDHSLQTFIDVQKQMWWYHTKLRATHPYTSMWYTWPFMIKPIWLYTSGEVGGKIANIYAMGNPLVFWVGLLSVLTALYYSIIEKSRKLALIVFSYLIFFIPWAASPRIMFLYHYLPSLPFLALSTGVLLRKNLKLAIILLPIFFIVYIYFFPHLTGIEVPKSLDTSFYWFDSWR